MKLIPREKDFKEDGLELFIVDKQYALNLQNSSESLESEQKSSGCICYSTFLANEMDNVVGYNTAKAYEK